MFIKSDQKTSHASNSKQFENTFSRALQNIYRKINAKASGLRENMLMYLSFLEAHSYPCIFSHQIEVIVYLSTQLKKPSYTPPPMHHHIFFSKKSTPFIKMKESTVILLVISRLSIRTSQIGFSATFILYCLVE